MVVKLKSFTHPNVIYTVDVINKTCSCPSFDKVTLCKHLNFLLYNEKPPKPPKPPKTVKKPSKRQIKDNNGNMISISLLKSNLQKAIRRNNADVATKTARILMEADKTDFLRRLAIIMVEDCIIHPLYPKVINLLRSREEFTEEDKTTIIQIVDEISRCEYVDVWVDRGYFYEVLDKDENIENVRDDILKKLNEEEKNFVDSIKYRSSIGGMEGDIIMMKFFYKLWVNRLAKKEFNLKKLNDFFETSKIRKFNEVENIKKSEILLEAVDFHCSPLLKILLRKQYVVDLLKSNYPEIETELCLKGIIWKQRSGVTVKKFFNNGLIKTFYDKPTFFKNMDVGKDIEIYSSIKEEVDSISRWFINTK